MGEHFQSIIPNKDGGFGGGYEFDRQEIQALEVLLVPGEVVEIPYQYEGISGATKIRLFDPESDLIKYRELVGTDFDSGTWVVINETYATRLEPGFKIKVMTSPYSFLHLGTVSSNASIVLHSPPIPVAVN